MRRPPPRSTPFPYTTLFRSPGGDPAAVGPDVVAPPRDALEPVEEPGGLDRLEPELRSHRLDLAPRDVDRAILQPPSEGRSEEHTSELQSRQYLVCRLLLEKK